jgi:hypothetical protein
VAVSALRISTPDHRPTFIDLGPTPWTPIKGTSRLRGRLCIPDPAPRYRSVDAKANARVQAFRKRHGGRVAA